jgi:hypothetical protein
MRHPILTRCPSLKVVCACTAVFLTCGCGLEHRVITLPACRFCLPASVPCSPCHCGRGHEDSARGIRP